ncbi:hypothetical protein [Gordonia sp. 'Campus']|uniref:hypothetical protein n=1 Tax=Gordonia sp. 'Campus' TaxID=2915824 RepID=UPI001EE3B9FA|nr:hypothetical protein [Gordonia sp. 'Campus']
MVYVVIAVFVVVMAVALVVLLGMAIGAFTAMFGGMREAFRRRRSADASHDVAVAPVPGSSDVPAPDLLGGLVDAMRLAQGRRWAACQAIQERLDADTAPTDESTAAREFVRLATDLWLGERGDHPLDPADVDRLRNDQVGQIAWTAGVVADRVSGHPAWELDFFDRHSVRVDLVGEVTSITTAAAGLRDQLAILGDAPKGDLGADADVVATFAEKSTLLSGRLDGLVRRLEAFADYERIVHRIQLRQDKQAWLDRVSEINEFEHVVSAEWDRAEGDRVRDLADESDVLASIYLDEIAPLAKSLESN